MENKNIYDVAIIGGGPAGIMAAISASLSGEKVILLEKNSDLGKKLLLTGNGRCNLTNAEFNLRELVKNYNNGEFLFHAFSVFGPKETIEFFDSIGVKTKIENKNRVFPKGNEAGRVLQALKKCLEKNKVEILLNSEIINIESKKGKIIKIILKDREVVAKKYILCTGGKSYSLTGSDGFGYKIAEELGHSIIEPKPALSPIILKEEWVRQLQGISLKNIKITVVQKNKKHFSEQGEIVFTASGLSGPAILNISSRVGDLLDKEEVEIYLDLFSLLNHEEILKEFDDIIKKYPSRNIKNIMSLLMPERFAEVMLGILQIQENKIANNISKIERENIAKILKAFKLTVDKISGLEIAMITKGGINLNEIDHKTMKSKIVDNLFFAGEIIDVDGKTGGFNLQECWSTGYLAGRNIVS